MSPYNRNSFNICAKIKIFNNFFYNFRPFNIDNSIIFAYNRKTIIMTIEQVIKEYDKVKAFPSKVDISFLRNNFDPILKENYPDVRISWACNSCVKNQMSLLLNWLTTKEAEAVKKKRNVRKKRTPKKKS